jgi:hypothetical protein
MGWSERSHRESMAYLVARDFCKHFFLEGSVRIFSDSAE